MYIANKGGTFDNYNFDDIAFYVEDYKNVRERQKESFDKEMSIYQLFSGYSDLVVFRPIEWRLVKYYFVKPCEGEGYSQKEKETCEFRNSIVTGSREEMNGQIFESDDDDEDMLL